MRLSKIMKVLLISIDSKYIHSNLAVRSIKAYAERAFRQEGGIDKDYGDIPEIEIAEYTINQPRHKVLADIYRRDADVIMFSCYIWNIDFVDKLAEDLSTVLPDVGIWLGGPEISFDDMQKRPASTVRGIMKGEGEEIFYRFIKDLVNSDKQQKADEGGLPEVLAADAPLDMDRLPFVYDDLGEFDNRIIYYESSRGCPFRCSYCLSSVDKSLRFRSMELVKKELGLFLEKKASQVKFVDRTFNCNNDRTIEIWKFLKENDNGVTNFHFEMAADILTGDEIELLSHLRPGQVQLEIGVQTTNEKTLEAIDRPMDFRRLTENVMKVKKAGNVHLHLDLIEGLPYEDIESFKSSFNDVMRLRPHQLQLGFLKVLKGSPIADKCDLFGIKCMASPPYEVLETKWLSYNELLRLKQVEEMVDVYYNSGRFSRSLEVLMAEFESSFDFFEMLAIWYEEQGAGLVNISRNKKYELLLRFGSQYTDIKDAVIYDFYAGDNVKTRPEFLGEDKVSKEYAKEFYSLEAREHRNISEGELATVDDPRTIRKHTHLERMCDEYLLFDYTRRDPITGNATVVVV